MAYALPVTDIPFVDAHDATDPNPRIEVRVGSLLDSWSGLTVPADALFGLLCGAPGSIDPGPPAFRQWLRAAVTLPVGVRNRKPTGSS
jgi:hypothetical protein